MSSNDLRMLGSSHKVSRCMDLGDAPAISNARTSSRSQFVPAVRMTSAEGWVVMEDRRPLGGV